MQRASRRTSHSFSVVASSPKRFFHFSRPWKKLSSTPYSLWFTQIFSISGSLRPSFRRTFFHLAPISSRMQWKWSSVTGCLSLPSEDISQLKDSVWLTEESAKKSKLFFRQYHRFYLNLFRKCADKLSPFIHPSRVNPTTGLYSSQLSSNILK